MTNEAKKAAIRCQEEASYWAWIARGYMFDYVKHEAPYWREAREWATGAQEYAAGCSAKARSILCD